MALDTVESLFKGGFRVTLVTRRVGSWFLRRLLSMGSVQVALRRPLPTSTANIILDAVQSFPSDCGLRFNFHGDVQPVDADIIYFHQFNVDYGFRSSARVRLKLLPQWEIRRRFLERVKENNRLVLVNSTFTMAEARHFWGLTNVEVLHPPVHVERYSDWPDGPRPRRVATVHRLDDYMLKVIKEVASSLDYEFVVMGSVKNVSSLKELSRLPRNVKVIPNADEPTKKAYLQASRAYFNANMFVEGFGIAVVEGMAAGALPVVRNVGGHLDYAPEDYMFNGIDDAIDKVEKAVESWDYEKASLMRSIAQRFSLGAYTDRLINIITKFL
ncbi:glycosyl transferase, group 1 [Acidilobus saccharovorans 345-15]|uniref:Glycosyl transferase, group 1 n=2 Tax=Acidilobus TaxID=105850 RepID=D9Q190_ACIS3|nr:glycosyl transferase, group 1 [Acidilobus saccharovorans 345-15]